MEYTTIADIIRNTKELNTSFTIPKKRKLSEDEAASKEAKKHEPESILNETYGNSVTESSAYQQVFSQGTQNTNQFSNAGAQPVTPTKEVPKNINRPHSNYSNLQDETLPKELKEQFQPLFCKLCSATLGSTINAKVHYGSKNHEKKVRRFLVEYAERTGEPLHKRAQVSSAKKEHEYNPKHYHCFVCDIPLTGKAHAESHYMGKNHQKVLSGKKSPAGKGYYNEGGKFVRIMSTPHDPTGRNGIGLDFARTETTNSSTTPKATSLRCELCKVSVTSLPQMDIHLQGQKHQKKLKASGLAQNPEPANTESSGSSSTQGNLYTSYRTPSGQYYCKVCDISLNSELQFSTHLQSRNHSKKSSVVKE